MFIQKNELAKIAIAKNLVKEYKTNDSERTVYLNNGTEFQIYIKNPYQYHVGMKIYLNDKFIGNTLVLRPGQSVWLERFLDKNDKFLFSTYDVEDTAEMSYATNKNGLVRVEFYKERETLNYSSPYGVGINTDWVNRGGYLDVQFNSSCSSKPTTQFNTSISSTDAKLTSSTLCGYDSAVDYISTLSTTVADASKATYVNCTKDISIDVVEKGISTIETGRVERGNKSDQKFDSVDMSFDYSPFQTENIKILPSSRKVMNVEETRRKYCSNCGKKVKPSDKFCSNCGTKLD